MIVKKIILYKLKMKLKHPFATSFGSITEKEFFLVEAVGHQGVSGFGETVAFTDPWYSEETVATNEHIMRDVLIPLLFEAPFTHPDEVNERFQSVRRNAMAKAAIEGAIWDLYAKACHVPLAVALGGTKREIPVGVSIGIQTDIPTLLRRVEEALKEGYQRIKLKVKPGKDLAILSAVRTHFPEVPLMADANSAYTLKDAEHLRRFDEFGLLMIEQPLAHNDLVEHAQLQKMLNTPICLDESIDSFHAAKQAIALGSCRVINLKIGRVGGLSETIKIHDLCRDNDIPLWCGGMLEAGVGRAHNIAITTLSQFTLPGDTAASANYWYEDIIEPEVTVTDGMIHVPDRPGIGFNVSREKMDKYLLESYTFEP